MHEFVFFFLTRSVQWEDETVKCGLKSHSDFSTSCQENLG